MHGHILPSLKCKNSVFFSQQKNFRNTLKFVDRIDHLSIDFLLFQLLLGNFRGKVFTETSDEHIDCAFRQFDFFVVDRDFDVNF